MTDQHNIPDITDEDLAALGWCGVAVVVMLVGAGLGLAWVLLCLS